MRVTKGFNRTVAFSWAGGKKWMADIIGLYLPSDIKRLLIPFFGRGDYLRLIRNMGIEAPALASDIHPWLVAAHRGIRQNPGDVVQLLKEHQDRHSSNHFIRVRDAFSQENPEPRIAADFIYMMNATYKACLKQGRNGERQNTSACRSVSCQPSAIYALAIALRNTELFVEDFSGMADRAREGDFILLDPPYVNAMGYGNVSFTKEDHIRLRDACLEIHRKGVPFMLASADDPWIRELFGAFSVETVTAPRGLGAERQKREIIVTNY